MSTHLNEICSSGTRIQNVFFHIVQPSACAHYSDDVMIVIVTYLDSVKSFTSTSIKFILERVKTELVEVFCQQFYRLWFYNALWEKCFFACRELFLVPTSCHRSNTKTTAQWQQIQALLFFQVVFPSTTPQQNTGSEQSKLHPGPSPIFSSNSLQISKNVKLFRWVSNNINAFYK